MALALVLALPAPAAWLRRAERPLILFAAIVAASALSFNLDLWLFGRFVDRALRPGIVDAATLPAPWPSKRPEPVAGRILFKFGVGEEYVRDGVMPSYDWSRIPLAFHTYFRSDRQGVLSETAAPRSDGGLQPTARPERGEAPHHPHMTRRTQWS